MKTVISNAIKIYDPSIEIIRWCLDNLVVTNPKYETLMRIGKEEQIRRYRIDKDMALYSTIGNIYIIPFGCLNALWKYIKDEPYELDFNNQNYTMPRNIKITQPLYDYQKAAAEAMLKNKGGILIGGCGSGKTNIAINIGYTIGKPVLWLTHTRDLLTQTVKRINSLYPGLDIGTITDGKINIGRDFTVATVQTMAKIDETIYKDTFDTVITDEAHHISMSPTLMKQFGVVISKIKARYKFGVTASDKRNDSLTPSMYAWVGTNPKGELAPTYRIDRKDTNTMTANHVRVDLNTPLHIINKENGKIEYPFLNNDGTFNYTKLIDFLSNNDDRNKAICAKVYEYDKKGAKQLILCSRIEHCEKLYNELLDKGLKAVLLVGKVTDKKRKQILNREIDWDIIVATLSLAKEGLDIPELNVVHLTTPISNKSDTVQSVGRIERVYPGKTWANALDYVDVNLPYCINRYNKRAGWLKNR